MDIVSCNRECFHDTVLFQIGKKIIFDTIARKVDITRRHYTVRYKLVLASRCCGMTAMIRLAREQ
jgi:hypothetical protein